MKTKIKTILEHIGFKQYRAGDEIYFLPVAGKIKPMTKIKLDTLLKLTESKDKVEKVIKIIKKPKKQKKQTKQNKAKGGKKQ